MPLAKLYQQVSDGVVQVIAIQEKMPVSYGTGSVIRSGDIVLTCAHCIVSESTMVVSNPSNPRIRVVEKLLLIDHHADIALLQLSQTVGSPITLANSRTCRIGDGAFVVGFPMGVAERTLVSAHIASITKTGLRIDASVNHGNSGGPLFNMKGEQIGVVNAKHGSLSQFLTQIQTHQTMAKMSIGGIDPVKAIQALIGEMQQNLNLGIGYAIKTEDIKPLHRVLNSSVPV